MMKMLNCCNFYVNTVNFIRIYVHVFYILIILLALMGLSGYVVFDIDNNKRNINYL